MQLVKIASSVVLALLFSACSFNNLNLNQTKKPKIDSSIEVIDRTSIKTIADINAIAFEWNKVNDPRVVGYHFYRGEVAKDGKKLQHIKTINNRHTTHFVDTKVKPNTKYVYKVSSAIKGDVESRTTAEYYVSTLSNLPEISFVQAIQNLPRQIKITWRPHNSQKVSKYIIQRLEANKKQWKNLASVDGRLQVEYIDDNLGDDETYFYRVIAQTFDKVNSIPSQTVKAKTKPLPLGITNFTVSTDQPRKIILNWDASKTSDVTKYTIYKSAYSGFTFADKIHLKSTQLTYVDKIKEDGKKYYYKITASDIDGLESKINLKPRKGMTLTKPMKPIIILGQIQGGKAILNWQAGDHRAVSYTVYKTIVENFFKSKVVKYTNVKDLRFQDEDIQRGMKYNYSIQAVDKHGLTSVKTDSTSLTLPQLKK